jgi:hypothetical protein
MRWMLRALSALCVVTFGYVWTVGQTGLDTTNKNLCELWNAIWLQPWLNCNFHTHILVLWGAFALVSALFLLTELARWLLRLAAPATPARNSRDLMSDLQAGKWRIKYPPLPHELPYDMPIYEVIAHVAKAIGDENNKEFFPQTRQTVRQAALNDEIKIKGNKSAKLMGGGWNTVNTFIPQYYWETADIGVLACDKDTDGDMHTFPHQFSDGRFGDEIFVYSKLRLNRNEVLRRWPGKR